MNNKVLLYGTGYYSQYLVITYNEKEYIYIHTYICVCVTESLCGIPETNTTW